MTFTHTKASELTSTPYDKPQIQPPLTQLKAKLSDAEFLTALLANTTDIAATKLLILMAPLMPMASLIPMDCCFLTTSTKRISSSIGFVKNSPLANFDLKNYPLADCHFYVDINTIKDNVKPAPIIEAENVRRLIILFNHLFKSQNVVLTHSKDEPEYYSATATKPARIEFAHGFFASALHEISHWCIAGKHRRTLPDFGYWYAPDGRTQLQQNAFEKVEIKPQALECLFTLACHRHFRVSQDNLFADFDTSASTFEQDVYAQAARYLNNPNTFPKDARHLLIALLVATRNNYWLIGKR